MGKHSNRNTPESCGKPSQKSGSCYNCNGVTNSMLMSMNKVPFGGMVRCPDNFIHIMNVFLNGLDDVTREVEQSYKRQKQFFCWITCTDQSCTRSSEIYYNKYGQFRVDIKWNVIILLICINLHKPHHAVRLTFGGCFKCFVCRKPYMK